MFGKYFRYSLPLLLASTSWLLGDSITPNCEHNAPWEEHTFSTLRLTKRYFERNGERVDSIHIRAMLEDDSFLPFNRTMMLSGVTVDDENVRKGEIVRIDLVFDWAAGGHIFHKE